MPYWKFAGTESDRHGLIRKSIAEINKVMNMPFCRSSVFMCETVSKPSQAVHKRPTWPLKIHFKLNGPISVIEFHPIDFGLNFTQCVENDAFEKRHGHHYPRPSYNRANYLG